jgi:cytochrome c biogenesis protein CcmG/thiol:disulfide interchange protein DsbE
MTPSAPPPFRSPHDAPGQPARAARRRCVGALLAGPVVLAAGAGPARAAGAAAGDPAPEIVAQTDTGPLTLREHRGRIVYLDFWASWCGPCRLSFPWMSAMQARYGDLGLQVLAVSLDARPDDARRFLAANPPGFQVAFDPAGESARRFAVRAMPTSVLIGADGRVIATHAGFRPADREPLEAGIREALARR